MRKYYLIFTFLFLIPTVSLAEKKNNKLTLSENEWKKLMDESYFMGMYDGHVMNACAVYLLGKIDKELKIDLIELDLSPVSFVVVWSRSEVGQKLQVI